MDHTSELLGEVTLPSGVLAVLDCGLLGMWSHDRPPQLPEGILDPETTESVNAGTDFEIVGADAEQAGRSFGRQPHPLFMYDVALSQVRELVSSFEDHVRSSSSRAELRPLGERVPHRTRLDQAAEFGQGAGEVFFYGVTGGVVGGLPRDRALPVHGARMGRGDFSECWDYVELRLRPEFSESRLEQAGRVAVDWARILFADADALGAWKHEEPCDGLADFVFWGLNAKELASALDAPALAEGEFGWVDTPVERAAELGMQAERLRDERGLRLATDFRPHSHHYAILEHMRASPTGSGTLEVGGSQLCALFTSWGDGFFPLLRVYEGEDLVAVRVQLGTEETLRAMREVNR
jgi:hypothetical protein